MYLIYITSTARYEQMNSSQDYDNILMKYNEQIQTKVQNTWLTRHPRPDVYTIETRISHDNKIDTSTNVWIVGCSLSKQQSMYINIHTQPFL